MKTYKILQDSEYFGLYASNKTSLFEQGLLSEYMGTGSYNFVVKVCEGQFTAYKMEAADLKQLLSKSWLKADQVSEFAGYNILKTDFTNPLDVVNLVHSLMSYHKPMELFSTSFYNTFEAFIQSEDGSIIGENDQYFESIEDFENKYVKTSNV